MELVSGESTVECERLPVVVNAVIALYAVDETVEYLQVAASLVVTAIVVWVVPAGRLVAGAVMVTDGGVVSASACVVMLAEFDAMETFPAASYAFAVYVYAVDAVRPVSLYEVSVGAPTCVPFLNT